MSSRRLGVVRPLLQMGLIPQITLGIIAGVLLAVVWPETAQSVSLLGQLFISALKAVAPILVFALVTAAIANHRQGQPTHIRGVLLLYVIGTLVAAVVAVIASFVFPTELTLELPEVSGNPPGGVVEILRNLLLSAVTNPVNALMEGNFIAILAWAVGLGLMLRQGRYPVCAAGNIRPGCQHPGRCRYKRAAGIWPSAWGHRWLYAVCGSGDQSVDCLPPHPPESLPSGICLFKRQCHHGLFYPQFRCQYPG